MKRVSRKLFQYPSSRRDNTVDIYHGVKVADPYRWLEDPESEESKKWVEQQNELTRNYLDELPARQQFEERLPSLWDYPKVSTPAKFGDYYYLSHNDGLQNQATLYRQATLDGEKEVVIDPNSLSEDGTLALTLQSYSKNGRFLAYNLAQSGSDWQTIHIRNLETGETFQEELAWVRFSSAAWLPDETGFYYGRYPDPATLPPEAAPSTYHKLYFHKLGTPQSEDVLIYERPDRPELAFNPTISEDGRFLALNVWEGTDRRNRIYYIDLEQGHNVIQLIDEMEASYTFIGNSGSLFYFLTDLEADNGRIIGIDITKPEKGQWLELIPESKQSIASCLIANNQFVVTRLEDASHKLAVYDLNGAAVNEISLPTLGSISQIHGKPTQTELFIHFVSFLYPPTVLKYDFESQNTTVLFQPTVNIDIEQYETHQVFFSSKDDTKIPMFLTHKKGLKLNGQSPTIVYGYGGFTVSMTPNFSPARLAWIEKGGVYAQVCLRGGKEYGESWHQAGMLDNKQNVFDDFIGATEWLIKHNYTSSKRVAIQGGSNGGLLVAACMLQRPELFGAVHCSVPVIDMLRYHKFTAGRFWTSEYGNAEENADHFEFMMKYSPLHNVKTGTTYPPLLITTADTDDRVVPMHAKKFAATLQAADPGYNPLLIRIETKAGHGLGKPTGKIIEEAVDVYSFLWTTLQSN
ncbi:MAG: prolyl oligopeptidase family serine peptidase [Chloroflexota bacterium]